MNVPSDEDVFGPDRQTLTEVKKCLVRAAIKALMECPENLRHMVACWFCPSCWRYEPPGSRCQCANDE